MSGPMVGEGQGRLGGSSGARPAGSGLGLERLPPDAPGAAAIHAAARQREKAAAEEAAFAASWDGKGSLADYLTDEDWAEARRLVAEIAKLEARALSITRSQVESDIRIGERKRADEEAKAALVAALRDGTPPLPQPDGTSLAQLEYQRRGWDVVARDCAKEIADAKTALRHETERLHVLAYDVARQAYVKAVEAVGHLHWLLSAWDGDRTGRNLPEGWERETFLAPYSGEVGAHFEKETPDGRRAPFVFVGGTFGSERPRKLWAIAVRRRLA